jgi:peptidoglycan LD-endopeptidase LytH
MTKRGSGITRVLATLYLIALHLVVIYFVGERLVARYITFPNSAIAGIEDPTGQTPVPIPEEVPELWTPEATPSPELIAPISDPTKLIIPVAGVGPDQLTDTFTASRSNGRNHDAIDIMAPGGTPVVAAVDGEIVKFFDSVAGGITIYQLSVDRRFIYYYAHLQRRADDVKVGDIVKQGKTIGYVGDTGNAGPGNNHLHFSIAQAIDPKRYWEGTYLNPYPYLKSGRAPEIH